MSYKTGDVYTGEFNDGLFDGTGMFKFKNGDVYRGQFKSGYKHGSGSLVIAKQEKDGEEYDTGGEYSGDFQLD